MTISEVWRGPREFGDRWGHQWAASLLLGAAAASFVKYRLQGTFYRVKKGKKLQLKASGLCLVSSLKFAKSFLASHSEVLNHDPTLSKYGGEGKY